MQPLELPHVNIFLPKASIALPIKKTHPWWQQRLALTSLAVVLGLTGGWVVEQAIAPAPVHAYTGIVNVTIDVQAGETYENLLRRAEAIARAAAQRSFDRDILVTDVAIAVLAQNSVATVPVVSLTATRPQWRGQPDPRRWSTYYSTAKSLLHLDNVSATAAPTQPTVTTLSTPPRSNTTAPTSVAPQTAPGRSTTTTSNPQPSTTQSPQPILPKRIPTPANIGK